jgi:hypothetical protein
MTQDHEQLALDEIAVRPLIAGEGATISERFDSFHRQNPWVYQALEELTRDEFARGNRRIGIAMLFEVLRWHYGRRTEGDQFRLNNNLRSRYARLLMHNHPEWGEVFTTRHLPSERAA